MNSYLFYEAVSYASLSTIDEVVGMLKNGADPNAVDGSGRTALALCVCPDPRHHRPVRLDKAAILIKYGANVDQVDRRGWTVAHECAWVGDLQLLQVLAGAGASFTIKNHDKSTPADLAFIKNRIKVCTYLDRHSLSLKAACRTAVRCKMGKLAYDRIDELPVPPSLKLYVNYGVPYPGWECIPLPEEPWSNEDLRSGKVNAEELKQFIDDHADSDFKVEYAVLSDDKCNNDCFSELVEAYQNLFITESFTKCSFKEPPPRKTRLGCKRFGVIDLAAFEEGALDFLLNSEV